MHSFCRFLPVNGHAVHTTVGFLQLQDECRTIVSQKLQKIQLQKIFFYYNNFILRERERERERGLPKWHRWDIIQNCLMFHQYWTYRKLYYPSKTSFFYLKKRDIVWATSNFLYNSIRYPTNHKLPTILNRTRLKICYKVLQ